MNTIEAVKHYYGKVLKKSQDMKSGLCNSSEPPPPHLRRLIRNIAAEISEKFFGCGCPLPPALEGRRVLDLGCGTGRDVYLASQLVGPEGHVVGVDMTGEQLEVAQRYLGEQMRRFRYPRANVEFMNGYIEDLRGLGLEDDSFDVVISDNTINLSPDKPRVFAEIMRVLKPGGELYFCDVFTSRRVPGEFNEDPMLVGECLAGAMYWNDCQHMLRQAGCPDARVVALRPITIENREILARVGSVEFFALTVRAFKLEGLEETLEDYGQSAYYLGSMAECPKSFTLDLEHTLIPACPLRIDGNTALMLGESRLAGHFLVVGERRFHFGPFTMLNSTAFPFGEVNRPFVRKETSTMMGTMQMPSMMGNQQASETMPGGATQQGSAGMQMPGMQMPGMMGGMMPGMGMSNPMMQMMACCNMCMAMCATMQQCCQEMMKCCQTALSQGSVPAARCTETINCCNQMTQCCNELTQCCRMMMSDPQQMMSQCQTMMNCCMNMMACCNTMVACCRNMMLPMMMQMGQQGGAMGQIMNCCTQMMNCCAQMMACCNACMGCCRMMMMTPNMQMGGMPMAGMMGQGGMGMMSGMGMMGGMPGMGSMPGMGGGYNFTI